MTDKILELADVFLGSAGSEYEPTRAALAAAIKAEQDYTAAVIDERDAFCTEADVLRMALTALKSERDELKALMHKALDERDHFIRERDGLCAARMAYASEFQCDADGLPDVGSVHQNIRALKAERDKLTMVHAERTVERDRLRKVARPVLTALEDYTTGSGGFCVCCGGESVCRKDCEINNAIDALRTELDHV